MKITVDSLMVTTFALCLLRLVTSRDGRLRHKSEGESVRRGRRASLRVTSVLMEPYLMKNSQFTNSSEHGTWIISDIRPRYSGYIPDLLQELSHLVGFSYEIHVVADGQYGSKRPDGWNGMVGELLRYSADLAAAPLYVTPQRASVVDFSLPFMHVNATVLLRKPPSGAELAITSATDLLSQSEIKFGTMSKGMMRRAFMRTNNTAYKKMWRKMEDPLSDVLTASNLEGIERVRRDKYAFIIPNTIGEYIKYLQPCDLVTVDSFLLKAAYGLAMRPGSRLLPEINQGLAILQNTGRLKSLRDKWWYEQSPCRASKARLRHSLGRSALSATYNYFTLTFSASLTALFTLNFSSCRVV